MSMGKEMMVESMIDHFIYLDNAVQDLRSGIWRGKDGAKYDVSEMKSSHIRNCIRMLERNIAAGVYDDEWISESEEELAVEWIDRFTAELRKRYPPIDPAFA